MPETAADPIVQQIEKQPTDTQALYACQLLAHASISAPDRVRTVSKGIAVWDWIAKQQYPVDELVSVFQRSGWVLGDITAGALADLSAWRGPQAASKHRLRRAVLNLYFSWAAWPWQVLAVPSGEVTPLSKNTIDALLCLNQTGISLALARQYLLQAYDQRLQRVQTRKTTGFKPADISQAVTWADAAVKNGLDQRHLNAAAISKRKLTAGKSRAKSVDTSFDSPSAPSLLRSDAANLLTPRGTPEASDSEEDESQRTQDHRRENGDVQETERRTSDDEGEARFADEHGLTFEPDLDIRSPAQSNEPTAERATAARAALSGYQEHPSIVGTHTNKTGDDLGIFKKTRIAPRRRSRSVPAATGATEDQRSFVATPGSIELGRRAPDIAAAQAFHTPSFYLPLEDLDRPSTPCPKRHTDFIARSLPKSASLPTSSFERPQIPASRLRPADGDEQHGSPHFTFEKPQETTANPDMAMSEQATVNNNGDQQRVQNVATSSITTGEAHTNGTSAENATGSNADTLHARTARIDPARTKLSSQGQQLRERLHAHESRLDGEFRAVLTTVMELMSSCLSPEDVRLVKDLRYKDSQLGRPSTDTRPALDVDLKKAKLARDEIQRKLARNRCEADNLGNSLTMLQEELEQHRRQLEGSAGIDREDWEAQIASIQEEIAQHMTRKEAVSLAKVQLEHDLRAPEELIAQIQTKIDTLGACNPSPADRAVVERWDEMMDHFRQVQAATALFLRPSRGTKRTRDDD